MRCFLHRLVWRAFVVLTCTLTIAPQAGCRRMPPAAPLAELRVLVPAAGLSSVEAEAQVAVPVERAVGGASQLVRMRSRITEAGTEVRLGVETGGDAAALRVREQLNTLSKQVDGLSTLETRRGPIIYRYSVAGAQHSISDLRTLHERIIRSALLTIPGVRDVSTCGGGLRRIEIRTDLAKVTAMGISARELVRSVSEFATSRGRGSDLIRSRGLPLPELPQLRVAERAGAPVFLRDVAAIRIGAVPATCLAGRDDAASVLSVNVRMTTGSEVDAVQRAIEAKLATLRAQLPPGVFLQPFAAVADAEPSIKKGPLLGLGQRLFPRVVPTVLRARISLPAEATPQAMRAQSEAVRALAGRLPAVASAVTELQLADELERGAVQGELSLLLALRPPSTEESLLEVASELLSKLAKLPGAPFELELAAEDKQGLWPEQRAPRGLSVHLHGQDLAQLAQAAAALRAALTGVFAVRAMRTEGTRQRPQVRLALDRPAMARHGVSSSDVLEAMKPALGGTTVGTVMEAEDAVDVVMVSGEEQTGQNDLPAVLGSLLLRGGDGQLVPLTQLVSVSTESLPSTILRDAGQRCVVVRITAPTLDPATLLAQSREWTRAVPLPVGVSLSLELSDD